MPSRAQPAGDRVGQRALVLDHQHPHQRPAPQGRTRRRRPPVRTGRAPACPAGGRGRPAATPSRSPAAPPPTRSPGGRRPARSAPPRPARPPGCRAPGTPAAARGHAPGRRTRRPAARRRAPSRTRRAVRRRSTVTTSRCPRGEPDQRVRDRQHPPRVDDGDADALRGQPLRRHDSRARRTRRRTTSSTAGRSASASSRSGSRSTSTPPIRRTAGTDADHRALRESQRRRPVVDRDGLGQLLAQRLGVPRRGDPHARARRPGSTGPTCRCATARRCR